MSTVAAVAVVWKEEANFECCCVQEKQEVASGTRGERENSYSLIDDCY
jgi:hypothetical protein